MDGSLTKRHMPVSLSLFTDAASICDNAGTRLGREIKGEDAHGGEKRPMEAAARSMSENIRRCFHLLLEIIARKSNRTLSKYLRQNNIPPRLYEIMTFISARPQNQAVISERLQINKNVMVRLIDELEERGLCLRVQKPGLRRREYNIQLTAKGSKALRDCEKLVRESEGELLSGLTQEERKELCRLLEKSLETELSP